KAKTALDPQLAAQGMSLVSLSCPSDLNATVGAAETCNASLSTGANLRISATITSVSGSNAHLDFKTAGIISVSASGVASDAKTVLNQKFAAHGMSIVSVSCPSDLNATVGAAETCTGSLSSGANLRIKATVTSVSGSTANLDFKIVGSTAPSSP